MLETQEKKFAKVGVGNDGFACGKKNGGWDEKTFCLHNALRKLAWLKLFIWSCLYEVRLFSEIIHLTNKWDYMIYGYVQLFDLQENDDDIMKCA